MAKNQDKEIQQYRDLMEVPEQFEDGFGPKMLIGALFLGFLMVPGSIYLFLFMGVGLGPAARWVTVILFAEVARRSMKSLRRQEVYLLFYMTGIAIGGELHGGVLSQLLWNQYLVQSPAAQGMGIATEIPWWVAPQDPEILEQRNFFMPGWGGPILFIVGLMIVNRIDHFGLSYALYRLTAHVERLPFPMAPVGAMGITAMAEERDNTNRWRWRCFSIGGVLGLGFGLVYVGVPAITGAVLNHPIQIIPIPWLDLTPTLSRGDFMPATPFNIVFDLSMVILGMVLPFWAVVGGFIGLLITWVMNPILYRNGILTSWSPGMGVVDTVFNNHVDFYLSFSIGLMLAIFLVSLGSVIRPAMEALRKGKNGQSSEGREHGALWTALFTRSRERGDISVLISLSIYVGSTLTYILISCWLLKPGPDEAAAYWSPVGGTNFPWPFFLGFSFIYQPIISYTHAKLEGIVGQTVRIPLVQEAAYILSGYKGAAIWFAPIPINDYGHGVRQFRIMELTGTRLKGVFKVELLAVPILTVSSLLFCQLIWSLAPIPSENYPFTQEIWHLQALHFSLKVTATSEGYSMFLEALKFDVLGLGVGIGLFSFALMTFLNMPTFLVYGAVRGLGQTSPGNVLPEMAGALIGRFYLQKRLGHQAYKKYIMVIMAGFMAGVGLVGMASVAIALIAKSTTTLGY